MLDVRDMSDNVEIGMEESLYERPADFLGCWNRCTRGPGREQYHDAMYVVCRELRHPWGIHCRLGVKAVWQALEWAAERIGASAVPGRIRRDNLDPVKALRTLVFLFDGRERRHCDVAKDITYAERVLTCVMAGIDHPGFVADEECIDIMDLEAEEAVDYMVLDMKRKGADLRDTEEHVKVVLENVLFVHVRRGGSPAWMASRVAIERQW